MINCDYLYLGVCGLANAHLVGTMAGHLGAAVAAGYFFAEDQPDLPAEVFQGIEEELDRVIVGEEAIWFNAKKVVITPSDLFRPFPKEPYQPEAINSIADTLQGSVGQTRQSGHNVIFASIAIRALHEHNEYASPNIINGIRMLVEGFNNSHAGMGYFGYEKGWLNGNQVKLPAADDFPLYQSSQQMVEVTIDELIATAAVRKQGFGGLWHIINHAAAIMELERFGYKDVAQNALPAHHQHIRLWRALPDLESELGPVVKAEHDARTPAYWMGMLKRDQARLTHRIKTLYGFYTVLQFIKNETKRKQAEYAFLYLIA